MASSFKLDPLVLKGVDQDQIYERWISWKRSLEHVLIATSIEEGKKFSNLMAYGGPELQKIYYALDKTAESSVSSYVEAITKLDEYFKPKHHQIYTRHKFWQLKREPDESIDDLIMRIRESASKCVFGSTELLSSDIAMTDKLLMLVSTDVKEKLLQKSDLTFDEAVKLVKAHDAAKFQAVELNRSVSKEINLNNLNERNESKCFRCGSRYHKADYKNCVARNVNCLSCGKKGHFAKVCRGGNMERRRREEEGTSKGEKRRCEEEGTSSRKSSFPKFKKQKLEIKNINNNIKDISICNVDWGGRRIVCNIQEMPISMLVDSGCEKNIIDENTWRLMIAKGFQPIREWKDDSLSFSGYGNSNLNQLTTFEADIMVNEFGNAERAQFYVIENGSQPLLGRLTAESLNILHMNIPNQSMPSINSIVSQQSSLKSPFPKIKGVKVHLPIKPNVKPVQLPLRRVPVALVTKIKQKLDELEEMDIIERVDGPSAWISALVPVVKDCGDIRLCVDLRRVNEAMEREHHPLPRFDDILPNLKNAAIFSVLDVKSAYHQCELDESSRDITTFLTQWGRYRYKRLVFGVNCAPEIYQKIMDAILSPCRNVVCYIDDILVFGSDENDHDESLTEVVKVLDEHNVLLNTQKSKIKMSEVTFLGHKLTSKGVEPTHDKLLAIKQFRAPISKEELRSFLGLVCYVSRFVPDFATLTDPLRQLLRKDVVFEWQSKHQEAFEKLKEVMSNPQTLGYFDEKDRTRLVADASPVGLGAVLIQFKNNEPRIIAYAAKSLTQAERRYCQSEKEALALVWSVERFSIYLLSLNFELETDHRSLETIFGVSSKPCARIERWVLRLQPYRYKVIYRKGSSNLADPLSRMSIQTSEDFDEHSEVYINQIKISAAIDIHEIELASEADSVLMELKQAIDSGNFDTKELSLYKFFKNELSYSGNIIIRQSQIVIPNSLRSRMLELGHEGHPGESLMKRRLRCRCWWPGMDDDVKKFVRKCEGCLLVSAPIRPEPMKRRELPKGPWIDLAINFLGPLPTLEYLLVVIDYFSRYQEVIVMKNITSEATIERLDTIFTRLGFPQTITLDKGKQFISHKFKEYCEKNAIVLNHTTPYWPQANGEVERQNRSLLKRLQIGYGKTGDWKSELNNFLLMYYTTPHSTTGKTPSELMFGRTIRSRLPQLCDVETAPVREEFSDRDKILKEKGKEVMDKRRCAKQSELKENDRVLLKNMRKDNKLTPRYNAQPFRIVKRKGSSVIVQNERTGERYERNVAHVTKIPNEDLEYNTNNDDRDEDITSSDGEQSEFYGFPG